MKRILCMVALSVWLPASQAQAPDRQILDVRVDRLEINTRGLTEASRSLSIAIDRLSDAFEKISENDENFTEEEKQALLGAARAVEQASKAIDYLASQLPRMSDDLTTRLPEVIEQTREPIADISGGLQAASTSVTNIVEHLPEATENTRQLVDAALDSALVRLSIFVVVALLALALVLILVLRYVLKAYVEPLVNVMAPFKDAPEHFDNLSKQMQQTSDNMIRLEQMKRGRWFRPPP